MIQISEHGLSISCPAETRSSIFNPPDDKAHPFHYNAKWTIVQEV